jgi:ABC-type phosphate/phosphonate transport system substrate-binding protein
VSQAVAALPMYDWPEARAETDGLWAAVRDRLRARGIEAPEALSREIGLMEGWTHQRLLLGQTCGLPLVGALAGRVVVIGGEDRALPGCPPGWYRSAVVVGEDDPRQDLADFRGSTLAINGFDSQSGWGAMLPHAAPQARSGRFFGRVRVTGAHITSVDRVAAGAADLAAIDLVTWGYCLRHRPAAKRLRVLMLTEPTPGLPYIAAHGAEVAARRAALAEARPGFVRMDVGEYRVVAERFAAAASVFAG